MKRVLLAARKKAGLTQEQMQYITDVDRSRYCGIELSKTDSRATEASAIADDIGGDAKIFFV